MRNHTNTARNAPQTPPPQTAISAASLLRLPAVLAAIGKGGGPKGMSGASTVWHWVSTGRFPQPIRFGRVTAWRSADVAQWLADPAAWHAANTGAVGG